MMQGRRDTVPLTSESEPIGGRAALCRDHNVMNDIFQRFAILMRSPSSRSRRLSMVGEKGRLDVLSWSLPVLAISFISGSIMSRASGAVAAAAAGHDLVAFIRLQATYRARTCRGIDTHLVANVRMAIRDV